MNRNAAVSAVSVLSVVGIMAIFWCGVARADDVPAGHDLVYTDEVRRLKHGREDETPAAIGRWAEASAFEKVALLGALSEPFTGGAPGRQTLGPQDARDPAVRAKAADAIAQLTGVKPESLGSKGGRVSEAEINARVSTVVEAYMRGVRDASRSSESVLTEALADRMKGHAKVFPAGIELPADLLRVMCREWQPVGKSVSSLERLLGVDVPVNEGSVRFLISPYAGGEVCLYVEGDRITGAVIRMGY